MTSNIQAPRDLLDRTPLTKVLGFGFGITIHVYESHPNPLSSVFKVPPDLLLVTPIVITVAHEKEEIPVSNLIGRTRQLGSVVERVRVSRPTLVERQLCSTEYLLFTMFALPDESRIPYRNVECTAPTTLD
ncbi:MAG: hypothetical protein ABI618_04685 [Nitrospirota bacterium]